MIPDFRDDGYLPNGVHLANENEVAKRFGSTSESRRRLVQRLRKLPCVGGTCFRSGMRKMVHRQSPRNRNSVIFATCLGSKGEEQATVECVVVHEVFVRADRKTGKP